MCRIGRYEGWEYAGGLRDSRRRKVRRDDGGDGGVEWWIMKVDIDKGDFGSGVLLESIMAQAHSEAFWWEEYG